MDTKYKMPHELKEKIAAGMEKQYSDTKKHRLALGMVCTAVVCFSAVTVLTHSDDITFTAGNIPEATDIIEQNHNNAEADMSTAYESFEPFTAEADMSMTNRFEPFAAEAVISGSTAAEALRDEICSVIKGNDFFRFPVSESEYADMTEYNGAYHIPVPAGTEVCSMGWGYVRETGFDPVYGNYVVIDHDGAGEFVYAHLSEAADIPPESSVEPGTVIGKSGSSGYTPEDMLLIRHLAASADGYRLDAEGSPVSLWAGSEKADRFYAYRNDDETADWIRIDGKINTQSIQLGASDMTGDDVNDLIIISPDENGAYVIDGERLQLMPIDNSFRNVLDTACVSIPYESRGGAFGICLTRPDVSENGSDNGRFSSGYFHIENDRLVFKAEADLDSNGFETKYTGTIDFKLDSSQNALVYSDMDISFSGGKWFDKCSDYITAYNGYIYGNEEPQSAVLEMLGNEKMRAFTGKELTDSKAYESCDILSTDITQTDFFLNELTEQIEGSVAYKLTLSTPDGTESTVNRSLFFVISRSENGYGIESVFDTTESSLAEKTLEFDEFAE